MSRATLKQPGYLADRLPALGSFFPSEIVWPQDPGRHEPPQLLERDRPARASPPTVEPCCLIGLVDNCNMLNRLDQPFGFSRLEPSSILTVSDQGG